MSPGPPQPGSERAVRAIASQSATDAKSVFPASAVNARRPHAYPREREIISISLTALTVRLSFPCPYPALTLQSGLHSARPAVGFLGSVPAYPFPLVLAFSSFFSFSFRSLPSTHAPLSLLPLSFIRGTDKLVTVRGASIKRDINKPRGRAGPQPDPKKPATGKSTHRVTERVRA